MLERFGIKKASAPASEYPPRDEVFGIPENIDAAGLISRIEKGENAEDAVIEEVDRLFNEWTEARQSVGLYLSESQSALWKLRNEAVEIAGEYTAAPSKTVLEGLEQKLEEMSAQSSVLEVEVNEAKKNLIESSEEVEASEPYTPAETRKQLSSAVRGFEEEKGENEKIHKIREEFLPYKIKVQEAEQAYLEAYKGFYGRNLSYAETFQNGTYVGNREPESLKEAERQYTAARLEYARQLDGSVDQRIQERIASGSLASEKGEKLRERYQRIVRFKEIAKPAAEAKYEARKEALSVRKQGVLRRGFNWYAKTNAELEQKHGKWTVRSAKAVLVTLGIGAVGATAGTVAVAGLGAWGVARVARVLASSAVGAAVGETVARVYGRTLGKSSQLNAENTLRNAGRGTGELSEDDLAAIDAMRMKLLKKADTETLERNKTILRAAATLLVAGSASAALSSVFDQPVAGGAQAETPEKPDEPTSAEEPTKEEAPSTEPTAPDQADAPSQKPETPGVQDKPAAEAPITLPESPTITAGEGADSLFYDLKNQLQTQYGDTPPDVPAVRAVLENNPHTFARSFGFSDDVSSRRMLVGENLRIDDSQLVFHDMNSGKDIVLIDSKGQVPVGTYEKIHTNMLPDEMSKPIAAEPAASPSTHTEFNDAFPETSELSQPEPSVVTDPANTDLQSNSSEEMISETVAVPQEKAPETELPPIQITDEPISSGETYDYPSEEAEPKPESAPQRAEAFVNMNGVTIDETQVRLYAVPDTSSPGKEALIAYGGTKMTTEESFARVQELAKANPGKVIYFQSPAPTAVNGYPQPWIASGTYTPNAGFSAVVTPDPSRPELVGVKLNPQAFTRIIN